MLKKSLNQFKFDSTRSEHFCYTFNNVERPVQTPGHLVQQSVERLLKRILKSFKWA